VESINYSFSRNKTFLCYKKSRPMGQLTTVACGLPLTRPTQWGCTTAYCVRKAARGHMWKLRQYSTSEQAMELWVAPVVYAVWKKKKPTDCRSEGHYGIGIRAPDVVLPCCHARFRGCIGPNL